MTVEDSVSAVSEYGPEDVILVMDTSFLTARSNAHLWATYAWLKAESIAKSTGRKFGFFIPNTVVNEYNGFFTNRTIDAAGMPFAHEALDELLGKLADLTAPTNEDSFRLAFGIWREHYSKRFNPNNSKGRHGPSPEDLSVNDYAIAIAKNGAEVYVASADFRDVIDPLKVLIEVQEAMRVQEVMGKKFNIEILPPVPIELKYFEGSGKNIETIISDEVVVDLQMAKLHRSYPTFVVFEKRVVCGEAVFDVAVGVVEKADPGPVVLPPEYDCLGKNFRLVPAVGVRSIRDSGDLRYVQSRLSEAIRKSGTDGVKLVVVQSEDPWSPLTFFPPRSGYKGYFKVNAFRAPSNFLYHQTTSVYAKTYFVPNSKK